MVLGMEPVYPGLSDARLIKRGAEACLYCGFWHGRRVVVKRRFPKPYRIAELDRRIRARRTVKEAQIMHRAKRAGVPTPLLYLVDVPNSTLVMEYVEGPQIKTLIERIGPEERVEIFSRIGRLIGRLHTSSIIHGDLTTSNMIMDPSGRIVFLDFGLSKRSNTLEDRGIDIHLAKRVLYSTHHKHAEECFSALMDGYAQVIGDERAGQVLEKVKEIEMRGRYVSERRAK